MENLPLIARSLLLLVLVVGLVGTVALAETSTTEVYWNLSGCWLDINYTGGSINTVNLGTVTNYSSGDVINNDGSAHNVQVTTNCNGYTVTVEATGFDLPTNHSESPGTAIQDFAVKGGNLTTYSYFTGGLNSPKTLADPNTPATTNLVMYYQYKLDSEDVPSPGTEEYRVYLLYTATS